MVVSFCLLFLFLFVTKCHSLPLSDAAKNERSVSEQVFSAAPNNTPITKVYIFGKPVYIREPFVLPQRDPESESLDFSKLFEAKRKNRGASYSGSPYATAPVIAPAPLQKYKIAPSEYPLKQCYTEKSGFMCCNPRLERVMDETAGKMKGKTCNLQKMSTMLQESSQKAFGTDFEALTGAGDFASKIHFYSDFVCKMERDGRTMLVYATPNRHNFAVPYQM